MKKSIDKSNLIAYNSIHKDCAQSNCKQIITGKDERKVKRKELKRKNPI